MPVDSHEQDIVQERVNTSTTQNTKFLVQEGTENDGSSESAEFVDAI